MEEPIQYRGGDSGIIIEDARPLFVDSIGGDNDGAAFVTCTDDLEKQVSAALIHWQIA